MPSDANGVYSLPSGYLGTTGGTILTSQHNPIFEDVAAAITGRLAINGANAMTGPLKHPDGTFGAPTMTFVSATNSGLYKTANGVGVAVGGAKVAEFTSAGLASGVRFLGELFPYVGSTAPALCVFPVGQTLSRTGYPDLWAFAQVEIAAGNTFFNNGDGSTTFGIGDCRGRVFANKDPSGTVLTYSGAATIGAKGGIDRQTLALGELPGGINSSAFNSITVASAANVLSGGGTTQFAGGANNLVQTNPTFGTLTSSGSNAISVTSNNTGGLSHSNTQPTITANFAMFAGA